MAIVIEPWRIPEEGQAISGEESPDALDLGPVRDMRPDGPIRYALQAQFVSGELIVTGRVEVALSLLCSRCGDPLVVTAAEPAFSAVLDVPDPHQRVDLTAEVRESIILAFPSYPLCTPACRGLCGRCGANLNKNKCRCPKPADEHWGAFDAL
jgi:uncharacterized protein